MCCNLFAKLSHFPFSCSFSASCQLLSAIREKRCLVERVAADAPLLSHHHYTKIVFPLKLLWAVPNRRKSHGAITVNLGVWRSDTTSDFWTSLVYTLFLVLFVLMFLQASQNALVFCRLLFGRNRAPFCCYTEDRDQPCQQLTVWFYTKSDLFKCTHDWQIFSWTLGSSSEFRCWDLIGLLLL